MRPSQLKHPVAVLRKIIGMGQKEFAAMMDCSVATIQSIELGPERLKLSEELAERIEVETGVWMGWLLFGDPKNPPVALVDADKVLFKLYTKNTFENHRAYLEAPKGHINDLALATTELLSQIGILSNITLRAFEKNKLSLFHYK